jgi:hypothetical protein
MDQTYALRNNVTYARMVNKAGSTVSPTVDAIRTGAAQRILVSALARVRGGRLTQCHFVAMEAGSSNVQNGTFTLDITNADRTLPGSAPEHPNSRPTPFVCVSSCVVVVCHVSCVLCCETEPESWPMSYLLYVTLSTNLTNPVTGCPSVKELLNILFWTQTNTAVPPPSTSCALRVIVVCRVGVVCVSRVVWCALTVAIDVCRRSTLRGSARIRFCRCRYSGSCSTRSPSFNATAESLSRPPPSWASARRSPSIPLGRTHAPPPPRSLIRVRR